MPRPRKALVSVEDTPYYHVGSRCVRRAFLCGFDQATQTSYEHRRQWIEDRIRLLSSLFAIDVCAYAVMSNHYHIVVKLAPDQSHIWTEEDVMKRWLCLYKGTLLVQKFNTGEGLSTAERQSVVDTLAIYKRRLTSLSWFMKCLNEPIARQANNEDKCTGHFWESRFKSKALHSEPALVTCMAYVDLNPIRAGLTQTPENSDFTSIRERISPIFELEKAVNDQLAAGSLQRFDVSLKPLLVFSGDSAVKNSSAIPFRFQDYLDLVDWTGRADRSDKKHAIAAHITPILQRLSQSPASWLANSAHFEDLYHGRSILKRSNE